MKKLLLRKKRQQKLAVVFNIQIQDKLLSKG